MGDKVKSVAPKARTRSNSGVVLWKELIPVLKWKEGTELYAALSFGMLPQNPNSKYLLAKECITVLLYYFISCTINQNRVKFIQGSQAFHLFFFEELLGYQLINCGAPINNPFIWIKNIYGTRYPYQTRRALIRQSRRHRRLQPWASHCTRFEVLTFLYTTWI